MKNVLLMMAGACAFAAGAAVTPASIFGDGMVLQRDKPVRVWGTAAAGEAVTVAFAGKTAQTQAAADGAWRVELPAFAASKEGRTLEIKGATSLFPRPESPRPRSCAISIPVRGSAPSTAMRASRSAPSTSATDRPRRKPFLTQS